MKAKRSPEESRKEMCEKMLEALWALNSVAVRADELGEANVVKKAEEMKTELCDIAKSMGFS